MKNEFSEYYQAIGITTEAENNRILELFEVTKKIINEKIIDTFVEEYWNGDGERVRNNLLFITAHYFLMIDDYMTQSDVAILPYKNVITSIIVMHSNYDFTEANNKSSLKYEFRFGSWDQAAFYLGLENNCDYLRTIYEKYLLPNLRKGESPPIV